MSQFKIGVYIAQMSSASVGFAH